MTKAPYWPQDGTEDPEPAHDPARDARLRREREERRVMNQRKLGEFGS